MHTTGTFLAIRELTGTSLFEDLKGLSDLF